MNQSTHRLSISTRGRGFHDLTRAVAGWIEKQGIRTGLLTIFLPHTSASLLIQENADPDVLRDLETFFARLVPDGDRIYRHTTEGPDDMPAHIRAALTQTHLAIPIVGGEVALGTWQAIYLVEHRTHAQRREVVLYLSGE